MTVPPIVVAILAVNPELLAWKSIVAELEIKPPELIVIAPPLPIFKSQLLGIVNPPVSVQGASIVTNPMLGTPNTSVKEIWSVASVIVASHLGDGAAGRTTPRKGSV